jgi:outer membrane receptor for ferrienterochelin and colicins
MKKLIMLHFLSLCIFSFAQNSTVVGKVISENKLVTNAKIAIQKTEFFAYTDTLGLFYIENIPVGSYKIQITAEGFKLLEKSIIIKENESLIVNFELDLKILDTKEVVVSATKTLKKNTDSPIIVKVINNATLNSLQACNLSEGLKFQPGLRVETNCQTCNYTQLRMNGLAGGYAQILINGRPIFSPLTGLYGLEQLPVNMIDRIEVVRGGGSSLYGSSAIGGTVNVITKVPRVNNYSINNTFQYIKNQTNDNLLNLNASLVSENKKTGLSLFLSHRNRGLYDANGDNFSEIPAIYNTSFGSNIFFLIDENQKLEISFSNINEYRFGGEMIEDKPAYLAQQSEERNHKVWMVNADYQINFDNKNTSFITYLAYQNTHRKHYTGIQPDDAIAFQTFLANPPYGISEVNTWNLGFQVNHKINHFISGQNVFTLGTEYLYDAVFDNIPAYHYLIDQTTDNLGLFLQSDWEITPKLCLLSGARIDKHTLVKEIILSPRTSILYKIKGNTQFRLSYGSGFKSPQAFDADMHIAFASGGISRISLAPDLQQEKSKSFSGSINYDKLMKNWNVGFTLDAFYNRLTDAFLLQPIGQDEFGELFEKQNGPCATIQGITFELSSKYKRKIIFESGVTIQSSKYDKPILNITGIEEMTAFVRTPNNYGYVILNFLPSKNWNATINYVYTGSMKIPHLSGAQGQPINELITSDPFSDLSAKISFIFNYNKMECSFEMYCGIKNIFDAYQDDFDIGKNRDSNFIYGPSQPRTIYIGLKIDSFK